MVIITKKASSSTIDYMYDVFLSFRGADTRNSFTNHLHKALEDANIKTFLDDTEIETGLCLKPKLESAIRESRISIVVMSKNYASSTWCLNELELILEQHRKFNQIVIPIFYHVEPTVVRNLTGSFKVGMDEHRKKMDEEPNTEIKSVWAQKIDIWEKTLAQFSNLKGKEPKDRLETEFIEDIVTEIYRQLGVPLRSILSQDPQLIGIDYSIHFLSSWLQDGSEHTADILTILGMGGIGKTSLAKHVYKLHCREFSRSSFVENISRRCVEQYIGLLDVQKQLCDDISKATSNPVHDVSAYTSTIENALARKKVLIVLDDIGSLDQLDALLGNKGFHPGSKIIITAKNTSLTQRCELFNSQVQPKHTTHVLRGLNKRASLKLFCLHAFKCEHPKEGYKEALDNIMKYCEGHPLALKVLGRSLYNRDVSYWEDCIESLKEEGDSRINEVLRISFDSLPSQKDKELFKHIACFFVGMNRDIAETILIACRMKTKSGITNLMDRCLLDIGRGNELIMHQLIQEMGRDAARQESPRSRLWCDEDSFDILKQKKGQRNIFGIALDMRNLEEEKLSGLTFKLEADALSKMDNLKLLLLNYVKDFRWLLNFPKELRWLCMHGFPLKSIPSDLPMKNLVALDMSYSNIKSFDVSCSSQQRPGESLQLTRSCSKAERLLGSLKILNLNYCNKLRSLGGFYDLPVLEMLFLKNCKSLIKVCGSIEHCDQIILVDLSYCKEFKKLLRTFTKLKKVKKILLYGCNSVFKSLTISFSSSLVILVLGYLQMSSVLPGLNCPSMQKYLLVYGNPLVLLPNRVSSLPRRAFLSINDCKNLTSVERTPEMLAEFSFKFSKIILRSQSSLQKTEFDRELSPVNLISSLGLLAAFHLNLKLLKTQPQWRRLACASEATGGFRFSIVHWGSIRSFAPGHPNQQGSQAYPVRGRSC